MMMHSLLILFLVVSQAQQTGVAMTVLAVLVYRQRRLSRYHFASFVAGAVYPCVIIPTVVVYGVLHH